MSQVVIHGKEGFCIKPAHICKKINPLHKRSPHRIVNTPIEPSPDKRMLPTHDANVILIFQLHNNITIFICCVNIKIFTLRFLLKMPRIKIFPVRTMLKLTFPSFPPLFCVALLAPQKNKFTRRNDRITRVLWSFVPADRVFEKPKCL